MMRFRKQPGSPGDGRGFWMVLGAVVAVVAAALALSACGGGGSGSTTEEAAAGGAETAAEESGGTAEESGGAAEEASEESEPPAGAVQKVKLVVKSDEEHGKKGPDGNWHDAFLPADFTVKAGDTVEVTVYNYDDSAHSFVSAELGANAIIGGGDENQPSKTTFTFKAPSKPGSYEWHCAIPCDEWAMVHFGYMKGHVTVT